MRISKIYSYDDIVALQRRILEEEPPEKCEGFNNMLFGYCWQAIDYVDMMREHDLPSEFAFASMPGITRAIGFLYQDEDKVEGDSVEERLSGVKDLLEGYLLFTLYNIHALKGMCVSIEMNEMETGLSLIVMSDETGEMLEFDIRELLNSAFCVIEYDEKDMKDGEFSFSLNIAQFLVRLLDA